MKKMSLKFATLIFLSLVALTSTVTAQEFKPFKVGLGVGYASASGNGASGGILVYAEPSYALNDKLSLSLRLETALITRGYSEDVNDVSFDVAAIGSYTVNGKYYFNTNTFRPFVGAGFGLYSLAAISVDNGQQSGEAVEAGSKFGFYPRVGFDAGHFNLFIDYNIIPPTSVEGSEGEFKNSYIGVHVGVSIGGGRN